jgi:hypothetical protein
MCRQDRQAKTVGGADCPHGDKFGGALAIGHMLFTDRFAERRCVQPIIVPSPSPSATETFNQLVGGGGVRFLWTVNARFHFPPDRKEILPEHRQLIAFRRDALRPH